MKLYKAIELQKKSDGLAKGIDWGYSAGYEKFKSKVA